MKTLRLAPHTEIARPLSVIEYMHASISRHPRAREPVRENIIILEGEGALDPVRLRAALDLVAAVNPAARLRLHGDSWRARWTSDGPLPALRVVDNCGWDGRGHEGAEFIRAIPLLHDGAPVCELVVLKTPGRGDRLVVRAAHAAFDALGVFHLYHELFRVLRGEPLVGSNADFTDVALMQHVGGKMQGGRFTPCLSLTGQARGSEAGDLWAHIPIPGRRSNSMFRLVEALITFARRQDAQGNCLFAVPVSLRRHMPDIQSCQNFTSMLLVEVRGDEGTEDFKRKFNAMLQANAETRYRPWVGHLFKLLPMARMDGMLSRTAANHLDKPLRETAAISHLGYHKQAMLSCPGYQAVALYGIPQTGSAFSGVIALERHLELMIGMPRVYGSEGRFEALVAHLKQAFDAERESS
jgi:hypothetical protein